MVFADVKLFQVHHFAQSLWNFCQSITTDVEVIEVKQVAMHLGWQNLDLLFLYSLCIDI